MWGPGAAGLAVGCYTRAGVPVFRRVGAGEAPQVPRIAIKCECESQGRPGSRSVEGTGLTSVGNGYVYVWRSGSGSSVGGSRHSVYSHGVQW